MKGDRHSAGIAANVLIVVRIRRYSFHGDTLIDLREQNSNWLLKK